MFCKKCGYISCVCRVRETHEDGCRLRISMECPVGVACDHGYDVCPICDKCTCGERITLQPLGAPSAEPADEEGVK